MFRQFRKIYRGEQFVAGGDCAVGLGDDSVCQFFSKTRLDVPLVYQSSRIATEMTNEIWPVLERIYDVTGIKPVIAYERASGGAMEMERLAALNRAGKFEIYRMPTIGLSEAGETARLGYDTNTATRPAMLGDLKEAVDKRLIKIYDEQTVEQLISFVIVRTSAAVKAQAERNAHDDLVMSLAIAYQLHLRVQAPQQRADYYIPPNYETRRRAY